MSTVTAMLVSWLRQLRQRDGTSSDRCPLMVRRVTGVAQAVTFIGGPLDGEVLFVPHTPSVLYVGRTIGPDGIVFVPTAYEAPEALRAGTYRRAVARAVGTRGLYRFEE
jgi:hypothetical protein